MIIKVEEHIELSLEEEKEISTQDIKNLEKNKEELISGAKAMKMLELSRHNFEKVIQEGLLSAEIEGNKKAYKKNDIEEFMKTDRYQELLNGIVDPRNNLNDLTGKDWLPETKSFFYQKGLGANHLEAQIEKLHPAPYSFQDIGHLVNFFTKSGMDVGCVKSFV